MVTSRLINFRRCIIIKFEIRQLFHSTFSFYWAQLKSVFFSILYYKKKIVPNKIIFNNFHGKGFGDNPRYIAEELAKLGNFDMVWIVNDDTVELPPYIRKVKKNTFKSFYEFSTAKIWIDNVRNTIRPIKKKEQVYLQTWHGSFSLKKIEREAIDKLDRGYVNFAKHDGKICNYILADSSISEEFYKKFFWLSPNTEILRYGFPRNDIFFQTIRHKDITKSIKKLFNINEDSKVILYAPTFRDDLSIEGYILDFERVITSFKQKISSDCVLLVKLHPNVTEMSRFITYNNYIVDATNYPSIQELTIASDFLITDYSSAYYDFFMLNKPIFLCALDREKYEIQRGLVKEYDDLPFPYANSIEQLIDNINSFDINEYRKKVALYKNKYPIYDTGNASIQVAKFLKKLID